MTIYFPNHTISIYRQRAQGNNKYTFSATYTAYSADIKPASQERTEFVDGRVGGTFVAYTDQTIDIKEGDQLVTEDGKRYGVRAVSNWYGNGFLDCKELTLVSQDK
jgi:hypothetical protein